MSEDRFRKVYSTEESPMNNDDDIREVYAAYDMLDAEHIRYVLTEAGILARITGAALLTIIGELPAQLSSPRIWVRDEDFERAKTLVEQEKAFQKKQRETRTDWICPMCAEENSAEFAICWACQHEYGANAS